MKDTRHPVEISYSLQLLAAGIPLEEANLAAGILYHDPYQLRTPQDQAIIQRVWEQLPIAEIRR